MDATLTRRGWAVAALTAGCVLLAAIFGARSLNAVVAPALVALVAAIVVVERAEQPTVERTTPPDGAPGDVHTVRLQASRTGTAVYTLRDRVSPWLSAPGAKHELTEDAATVTYDVRYDRRGVHRIGPLAVTVTDVLGLAERTLPPVGETDVVLVHPELVEPPSALRSSLETVVDLERRPGRDEFDRLREYVRGDSPRDVHWKSSAKRAEDDLVVKEFLGRTPTDAVRIAVDAKGDRDAQDVAAEAAASVAITLLEEGVEVGLETPEESLAPGVGSSQRDAILAALARLEDGEAEADDATIHVVTHDGETNVHVGGRAVAFDRSAGRARDGQQSGDRGPPEEAAGDDVAPDADEVVA